MCTGEADGSSREEESIHADDVRKRRQGDRRLSLDGSTASSSCESSELGIAHPETKKDGTENCTSSGKNGYILMMLDNNNVLWTIRDVRVNMGLNQLRGPELAYTTED